MSLRVSGKNLQIGESLQDYARTRVAAVLGRYYEGETNGHVTLEPEGPGYRCEMVLHLGSGTMLHAEGRAQEPYASFDQANHRVETRLRRHKRRLKSKHGMPAGGIPDPEISTYTIEALADEDVAMEDGPVVVAETRAPLRTFSVAAAVNELDLSGLPVLVFRHSGNGHVNIVYRRPDGHIGWIDPSTADS